MKQQVLQAHLWCFWDTNQAGKSLECVRVASQALRTPEEPARTPAAQEDSVSRAPDPSCFLRPPISVPSVPGLGISAFCCPTSNVIDESTVVGVGVNILPFPVHFNAGVLGEVPLFNPRSGSTDLGTSGPGGRDGGYEAHQWFDRVQRGLLCA